MKRPDIERRRGFLRQSLSTVSLTPGALLSGCESAAHVSGGFTGPDIGRGHLLRDHTAPLPAAASTPRSARILIVGGGIAGLAAAWTLLQSGITDFALLELESTAGGNSRGHLVKGMACPLGAHYLPVPFGDTGRAQQVSQGMEAIRGFLQAQGLVQFNMGRWSVTEPGERHLCHSPQERLFDRGVWQEGLLPVVDLKPATLREYQRFSESIRAFRDSGTFSIPSFASRPDEKRRALDRATFSSWLGANSFQDPNLLWYLDYCCRDDYGAGIDIVSAWAGVHYFASRHGFQAPGSLSENHAQQESPGDVFTWPQGNGWLSERLSEPLAGQILYGRLVREVTEMPGGVRVTADHQGRAEIWEAGHCIVATPLFIARRLVHTQDASLRAALDQAAVATQYASWAVINAGLSEALKDRGGAAPAWDNVIRSAHGLGYVDASHQSLGQARGPVVLTWYEALGTGPGVRKQLLERSWTSWLERAGTELMTAHPDFMSKLGHLDVARFGHAMATPVPGHWQDARMAARRKLLDSPSSLSFAHADLAGYSVFEEAFSLGVAAAHRARSPGPLAALAKTLQ